jgi:hypothetical protein
LAAAAELARVPTELDNLNVGALLIMFGAIYVFIIGIGMAGWMRSRIAGIITTIFALVSTCLITYVIYSVLALFM